MANCNQKFMVLCMALLLANPKPAVGDDLAIYFASIPGQQEFWKELKKKLAPAQTADDYLGPFFSGRILNYIPAVDPSAPMVSPDHWAKVVFEAYGPNGVKSRKPALLSMHDIMKNGMHFSGETIDTVDDFSLLMSNRHEIMDVDFGSAAHRQAIFSALDPDGSMLLSSGGGSARAYDGLIEGGLMNFGRQGPLSVKHFGYWENNPIDPHYFFDDNRFQRLPGDLLEEYARSKRYPGHAPEFGEMARATLQMLYTLSVVTPDLTTSQFRSRAVRYHSVGRSLYSALGDALQYQTDLSAWTEIVNRTSPFTPVTPDELRSAAIDVMLDGPVVPHAEEFGNAAFWPSLVQIMSGNSPLAPSARIIIERFLAPELGEAPEVSELYEIDREAYRREAWNELIKNIYDHDEINLSPIAHSLAWAGWAGDEEFVLEEVDWLFDRADKSGASSESNDPGSQKALEVLKLMLLYQETTREDRQKYAIIVANEVNRRIDIIRKYIKDGRASLSTVNFVKALDALDK